MSLDTFIHLRRILHISRIYYFTCELKSETDAKNLKMSKNWLQGLIDNKIHYHSLYHYEMIKGSYMF